MENIPIGDTSLSNRAKNNLKRHGIMTTRQLAAASASEISTFPGIGGKTYSEIFSFKCEINREIAFIPVQTLSLSREACDALYQRNVRFISELIRLSDVGIKEITPEYADEIISGRNTWIMEEPENSGVAGKSLSVRSDLDTLYMLYDDLQLSTRAMHALKNMEFACADDLLCITRKDLSNLRGCGQATKNEIFGKIELYKKSRARAGQQEYAEDVKALINAFLTSVPLEEPVDYQSFLLIPDVSDAFNRFFHMVANKGYVKEEIFNYHIKSIGLGDEFKAFLAENRYIALWNGYCFKYAPLAAEYIESLKDEDRNTEIFKKRLSGFTLEEIAQNYGLTRERVRQICLRRARKTPLLLEDSFKEIFETFSVSKKQYLSFFPESGTIGFMYLNSIYRDGKVPLASDTIENYDGDFKDILSVFLLEEEKRYELEHASASQIALFALRDLGRKTDIKTIDKLCEAYAGEHGYSKQEFNLRTMRNCLRSCPGIVFDRDNMVRYWGGDGKSVVKELNLQQYDNHVYSAVYIWNQNKDLMYENDIRDGYELFYVIKNFCDNEEVCCRRVPVIVFGGGTEEKQAAELLEEISPVTPSEFCRQYSKLYGMQFRNIMANVPLQKSLRRYKKGHLLQSGSVFADEDEAHGLKDALQEKDFWTIPEVKELFLKLGLGKEKFNKASFAQVGYFLFSSCVISTEYKNLCDYLKKTYFNGSRIEYEDFPSCLKKTSSFAHTLCREKEELNYIMVGNTLIPFSEIEEKYGISKEDARKMLFAIKELCPDPYFNVKSAWKYIKEDPLFMRFKDNKQLCSCILGQITGSTKISGRAILSKENKNFSCDEVLLWYAEKHKIKDPGEFKIKFDAFFDVDVFIYKAAAAAGRA